MTDLDASIGVALLSGLLAAAAIGLVTAVLYPRIRARLAALPPRLLHGVLLSILIAPVAFGALFAALLIGPATDYGVIAHHCHADGIGGCTPHVQKRLDEALSLLTILVIGVVAAWPLTRLIARVAALAKARRRLNIGAAAREGEDLAVIEDCRPLAFTLGFFRPGVFVSSGLAEKLSPVQLEIVLRHERAHMRRRDALWHLIASIFSVGHGRAAARQLLADLHLAAERICDEAAAGTPARRLDVAETIVKVERLCRAHDLTPTLAVAAHGGSVPARVESLLKPARAEDPRAHLAALAALPALGAMAFVAAEPTHHVIEAILYRFIS